MRDRATRRPTAGWIVGTALALAVVAMLVVVLFRSQELPRGVQPIAWDRETCSRCHMHISDPRYAAQLQTNDRRILDFDDPGCLMLFVAEHRPPVHAIYFHHIAEDRWLTLGEVAFLPGQPTPMRYGFGAVARGTPGAISYDEAAARVAERERTDGGV